jgi:RNA polymerase sigma factor (sigma-70 family)
MDEPGALSRGTSVPVPALRDVPEELSFEMFFEAERRQLFRALYLITGSTLDAEELTQDAFLKVWERWDRVQVMESATGYLYRIALNAARSRYRRLVLSAKHAFTTADVDIVDDPYRAADDRDAVERALRRLTPRQRAALVVSELLDLGSERAAELLGIRPSTVRNQVAKAHATLRTAMETDDE